MPKYKIAGVGELKQGRGIVRTVEGTDIALFSVEGEVIAVNNYCPHQHVSKLHESIVEGTVITCPMHGWTFDLKSGSSVNASGHLKKIAAEVRGTDIYVTLNDAY
jgi:nitrite reductase/ring-hydroxylating ferredoxin subunit